MSSVMLIKRNRRMALDYRQCFGDRGLGFGYHGFVVKLALAELDRNTGGWFNTADESDYNQVAREAVQHDLAQVRYGARYRYFRLVELPLLARLARFAATGSIDSPNVP